MRRLAAGLLVAFAVMASPAQGLAAESGDALPTNVTDIVGIDRDLDGSLVLFQGEAIGEDLRADADHRWVNVLGRDVAIGVFVTDEQAAQVEIYGDHGHRGATVEVVGRVNVACDEHGGEFDVHAEEFRVLEPGETIERPIAPLKIVAVAALLLVALLEVWLYRRILERRMA